MEVYFTFHLYIKIDIYEYDMILKKFRIRGSNPARQGENLVS